MTTDVQSFAFGRGELQAPVMLSGLDRLGDKLGRRIRALIEPIAGVRPNVEAQDARARAAAAAVPAVRNVRREGTAQVTGWRWSAAGAAVPVARNVRREGTAQVTGWRWSAGVEGTQRRRRRHITR